MGIVTKVFITGESGIALPEILERLIIDNNVNNNVGIDVDIENLRKYIDRFKKIRLDRYKQLNHTSDILYYLIHNLTFDFAFAKELRLYDIVSPDCLLKNNKQSESIINLLSYDIKFILCRRYIHNLNKIELHFEVCHEDDDWDLHSFMTGRG